jgi:hypothetical protein
MPPKTIIDDFKVKYSKVFDSNLSMDDFVILKMEWLTQSHKQNSLLDISDFEVNSDSASEHEEPVEEAALPEIESLEVNVEKEEAKPSYPSDVEMKEEEMQPEEPTRTSRPSRATAQKSPSPVKEAA